MLPSLSAIPVAVCTQTPDVTVAVCLSVYIYTYIFVSIGIYKLHFLTGKYKGFPPQLPALNIKIFNNLIINIQGCLFPFAQPLAITLNHHWDEQALALHGF